MADVFISYARGDHIWVERLVRALEAESFTVWWDTTLHPGDRFEEVVRQELSIASCVIVVWSHLSINSDWVYGEADEGRQYGKLLPILMEPVTPPTVFRRIHTANLTTWLGQKTHSELDLLVDTVRARTGKGRPQYMDALTGPRVVAPEHVAAEQPPRRPAWLEALIGIELAIRGSPSLLVSGALFCLRRWRLATLLATAAITVLVTGRSAWNGGVLNVSNAPASAAAQNLSLIAVPEAGAHSSARTIGSSHQNDLPVAQYSDPALIEDTPDGPLPRISVDGRKSMTAYAPKFSDRPGPRIAIVVGGLGLSEKLTVTAIECLPPAVTLAFAPYSNDLQRWVNQARQSGHEVLVEVPLEPYDFPDSDFGPHMSRVDGTSDANIQRLNWSLTRFTGYAGVTNLLGRKFLADEGSLEPLMAFAARRGLFFLENNEDVHSAGPAVAQRINAPYVRSTDVLDGLQDAVSIDKKLSALEVRARQHGAALGTGFLYPVTIERISIWAQSLSARGSNLVPASALIAVGD